MVESGAGERVATDRAPVDLNEVKSTGWMSQAPRTRSCEPAKEKVVAGRLFLARRVRKPLHGIDVIELAAATLPQPELPLLQHVLKRLAVQTEGFLLPSELALSYPEVYVSRLPSSL